MHIAQFKATTTNRVAIYFLIVGPLVVLACFQSLQIFFMHIDARASRNELE